MFFCLKLQEAAHVDRCFFFLACGRDKPHRLMFFCFVCLRPRQATQVDCCFVLSFCLRPPQASQVDCCFVFCLRAAASTCCLLFSLLDSHPTHRFDCSFFACLQAAQVDLCVRAAARGLTVSPPPTQAAVTGSAFVFSFFGRYRPPQRMIVVLLCCVFFLLRLLQAALVDCCYVLTCLWPRAQVDCCFPDCGEIVVFLACSCKRLHSFDSFFLLCGCDRPLHGWLCFFLLVAVTGRHTG